MNSLTLASILVCMQFHFHKIVTQNTKVSESYHRGNPFSSYQVNIKRPSWSLLSDRLNGQNTLLACLSQNCRCMVLSRFSNGLEGTRQNSAMVLNFTLPTYIYPGSLPRITCVFEEEAFKSLTDNGGGVTLRKRLIRNILKV